MKVDWAKKVGYAVGYIGGTVIFLCICAVIITITIVAIRFAFGVAF